MATPTASDPPQEIDWSMLMDDFDWNEHDTDFFGL